MKVAVIGSRTFNNYELLRKVLKRFFPDAKLIISGHASGADTLAEKYAEEVGIETLIFKPDWQKMGRSAGYIRNKQIVENAQVLCVFWDAFSKGTEHSINLAKEMKKPTFIIYF